MHAEAFAWVRQQMRGVDVAPLRVLEIGSYDVNGSVRPLFEGCAEYVGIDERPGPGVDLAASARGYDGRGFDVVVTTETLEHAADPLEVIRCAHRALKPGGRLIVTAAGPGRRPHGNDGGRPGKGEHYRNVTSDELWQHLDRCGFAKMRVQHWPERGDVYAVATKRR